MRFGFLRNGDGFILVYSITDKSSFDFLPDLIIEILRAKDSDNVPIILVGNKTDLEDDRVVTTQRGEILASKYNCKFFETSTNSGLSNNHIFHDLVREIRKNNVNNEDYTENLFLDIQNTKAKDKQKKEKEEKRNR